MAGNMHGVASLVKRAGLIGPSRRAGDAVATGLEQKKGGPVDPGRPSDISNRKMNSTLSLT